MQPWIFYAFLSAFSAAGVAIFGKIGIANIDSTLATAVRAVIMAIFLVMMALVLGKASLIDTIDGRAFRFIVFSGIAGALSWLFYFFSLKHGPPTGVVAIDRLSVVFVLVLSLIFLGAKFTWQAGLGAILVSVGAFLLSI